jgi:hypothetical protein
MKGGDIHDNNPHPDRYEFCDGIVYIFICEYVDTQGWANNCYRADDICNDGGNRAKWLVNKRNRSTGIFALRSN